MSDKKKERIDIHEYLAQFDDIPGTRVFTAQRARKGYNLNQFAMSLMKEENRERFLADEKAYLDVVGDYGFTKEERPDGSITTDQLCKGELPTADS